MHPTKINSHLTCLHWLSTGPFIVVVPLSTMPAWRREFAKWAPFLNAIIYSGNQAAREVIRKNEWWSHVADARGRKNSKRRCAKFDVLLTTYEYVLCDKTELKSFAWEFLMVDEAHRLV